MASISANGSRGHHKFTLNVWESYVSDGASNYSTTNWSLILSPIANGWDWNYSSTVPVTWAVGIDGNNYNGNIMSYDGRSTVEVASGSLNITHDSEGYKSIGFDFSISSINVSYLPGSASASGSMQLTTIPRASNVTATNADIESATSININRASNNFTHTLRYLFGSLSGTIATNVDTSYGWTIPTTFYAQIPNSKTGTCTIYCDTYSGSTLIGTKSTTFIVTANENLSKPTVQGAVVDINEDTILLTGNNTKIVKYKSTARVTYNANANKSASISNVKINNVTVTGQSGYYDIENTEAVQYEIIATDSRGYSSVLLLQPTIVNYIPLTINSTVFRTAPTTGEISSSFSGNYFNDTFGDETNELQLGYFYREKGTTDWLFGARFTENTDFVITNNTYHSGTGNYEQSIILNRTFDYTKVFEIRVWCADKLSNGMIDFTVAKGKPIINWDDDHLNVNGDITINELPFITNLIKTQTIYISVGNLTANGGELYDQSTSYNIESGYSCLGVLSHSLAGSYYTNCLLSRISSDNNYIYWAVKNIGSQQATNIELGVTLLLVKTN